jgi:hypothetical protein
VNQTDHTIILTVPAGTDVTKLVPSTVISPNATLLPPDGQAQDFTKPVVYTITAEDGSAQDYTVIVNVEKPPVKKSSKIGGVIMTMLVLLVIVGVAITGVVIFLRKKNSNNLDF